MADNIVLASFCCLRNAAILVGVNFGVGRATVGRVDRLAVDACFIMQVRAGRTAGCTDKTNHFAGTDSAVGRTERAHVAVQGFHTVGMANHHGVTVPPFQPLKITSPSAAALIGVPVGAA